MKSRYMLHADDERLHDNLTLDDLEHVLLNGELIEQYPEDPRGESCLVWGRTASGVDVHAVCGKNSNGRLRIITDYIPKTPKWRDPKTRTR